MIERLNAVNWFEIPVTDMTRATSFYEGVFEITLSLQDASSIQMAWFPMTAGAPGATGTLMRAPGYEPSEVGTIVYFAVRDIDETLRRVEERGGQTLMAKTSIGEHGFVAHFRDSEGNRVALHART